MSEEEKIQALVSQMKMYESYFNDILTRENTVTRMMEEGGLAIEAIKNISGQDTVHTLMPIGTGIYLQASASPNNKLIINIGAGVAIEKDKNSTINFLESRLKEMQVTLQETVGQKQQVATSLEQGKQQMEQLMATRSKK